MPASTTPSSTRTDQAGKGMSKVVKADLAQSLSAEQRLNARSVMCAPLKRVGQANGVRDWPLSPRFARGRVNSLRNAGNRPAPVSDDP